MFSWNILFLSGIAGDEKFFEGCLRFPLSLHVGCCVFVDAEHALDPALAEAIGVNTENLLISQPDCGEQALSLVDTLIRSGSVDVVVVDSVSMTYTRSLVVNSNYFH